MLFSEVRPDFRENRRDLIGFHCEDDHLRGLDDVGVEAGGVDPGILRDGGAGGLVGIAGDDRVGGGQPGADESLGQGGRHFAGTEETDLQGGRHARVLTVAPHERN